MDTAVGLDFLDTSNSELNDELTKCGEICVSFSSFDIVFFCLFCNNQTKYSTFNDYADHMKGDHFNYDIDSQTKPLDPIDLYVEEQIEDVAYRKSQSDVLADIDIVYAYLNGSEGANIEMNSNCSSAITQNTTTCSNVDILMSNRDNLNNANSAGKNSDCSAPITTQNTDLYSDVGILMANGEKINVSNSQCTEKNSGCSTAVTQNPDLYRNVEMLMSNEDNINISNSLCTDKNSDCSTAITHNTNPYSNVGILMPDEGNINIVNSQCTDNVHFSNSQCTDNNSDCLAANIQKLLLSKEDNFNISNTLCTDKNSDCSTADTQNTELYGNVEILLSKDDNISNRQCTDKNSDCLTAITQNANLYSNVGIFIPNEDNINIVNSQSTDKNSESVKTKNTELYGNLEILLSKEDNFNISNSQCIGKNSDCLTANTQSTELYSTVEILVPNEDNINSTNIESTDKCMIEVLDTYRKCIGLWHIKSAENTSLNVKAEAFRLLHTIYSAYHKESTLDDLENRLSNMTDLVNAEIDFGFQRDDGQSKLWYFNNLWFLRYANDEEIPDEEFEDFNCRMCEETVAEFTCSDDLWTHIITKHLGITKKFRLRPACREKTFPLKWPEDNILQFIDLYREQECLWNLKSNAYHNYSLKTNAYMVIVEKFEEICPNVLKDRSSVKVAIRHLRDYFGRVDKKCKNANPTDTSIWYSKSKIYQKLLFLRDVYIPRHPPSVKVHTCELCGKTFEKRKELLAHIKTKHVGAIYKCEKCPLIFKTQYQIETHRKEHLNKPDAADGNKYTCPICQANCKSSQDLASHLNKHLPKKSHTHVCEICSAKFDDRNSLLIHIKRHTNTKNYTCDVCKKGFVTSTELKAHVVMHSNEMPFVCDTCGLKFKFQNQLGHHRLFHGEPKFECSQCDMKFITNRHLVHHQRSHGPIPKVGCDICDRLFRNLDSLMRHKRKIHNIKRREQPKVVYSEADFSEIIL